MEAIEILGVPASPYTRKMLALLRYRRIPYRVLWGSHIEPPAGYPAPKVKLLPTVYLHTEVGHEAIVDSTPIIDLLEGLYSERSVRPQDEVLHFLDLLIEDFADEWLTKAMFHYRWSFDQDAKNAGPYIAYGQNPQFERAAANGLSEAFSKRQISRLASGGTHLRNPDLRQRLDSVCPSCLAMRPTEGHKRSSAISRQKGEVGNKLKKAKRNP